MVVGNQPHFMDPMHIQQDSAAWITFVKLAFLLALAATATGICFMPGDWWIKGYFAMGTLFLVASTIAMTKTLRDEHEARKIIAKINDVKTQKILREFEPAA